MSEMAISSDIKEIRSEFDAKLAEVKSGAQREWKKMLAEIRQKWYRDDPARCFGWITKDTSPRCEIEPKRATEFFASRWSEEIRLLDRLENDIYAHSNIGEGKVDEGNNLFEVNGTVNQEISANMRSDLLNTVDMIKAIKRKGNLSAPGPDGLTYPILKIEKERAVSMMIELMKMLLKWGKCPMCWKRARTILLYKGGDKEAPENWRPISLTNILYRTVFGRFAK
jgi:hypothetical protein